MLPRMVWPDPGPEAVGTFPVLTLHERKIAVPVVASWARVDFPSETHADRSGGSPSLGGASGSPPEVAVNSDHSWRVPDAKCNRPTRPLSKAKSSTDTCQSAGSSSTPSRHILPRSRLPSRWNRIRYHVEPSSSNGRGVLANVV